MTQARCSCIRWVAAAQMAMVRETIVHSDKPWIQLKWTGVEPLDAERAEGDPIHVRHPHSSDAAVQEVAFVPAGEKVAAEDDGRGGSHGVQGDEGGPPGHEGSSYNSVICDSVIVTVVPAVKTHTEELASRLVDEAGRHLVGGRGRRAQPAQVGASHRHLDHGGLQTLFGDKQGLLDAMYREGYLRLGAAMRAAATPVAGDPLDALAKPWLRLSRERPSEPTPVRPHVRPSGRGVRPGPRREGDRRLRLSTSGGHCPSLCRRRLARRRLRTDRPALVGRLPRNGQPRTGRTPPRRPCPYGHTSTRKRWSSAAGPIFLSPDPLFRR